MKKITAILLALVLVLAMSTSAFADTADEPTKYTITVNGAVVGQTYSLYKLLDLSYDETNDAYYYTVNSAWTGFFAQTTIKDVYVEIAASGAVTWVNNADAQEFAKLALAYAKANSIATVGDPVTATANAATTDNDYDATASFEVTELGYYLVGTSLGALVSVDTVSKEAITVYEKNDYPTLEKTVYEDSVDCYQETATADEGVNVSFKLEVTLPDNDAYTAGETESTEGNGVDKNFVITDNLPKGTTYVGDVVCKVNGVENTAILSVSNPVVNTNGDTTVTFTLDADKLAALKNKDTDTVIVITYDAKLDSNAAAGTAYTNTATLAYGTHVTTQVDASLTTYAVSIYKWATVAGEKKGLAEAGFQLYKEIEEAVEAGGEGEPTTETVKYWFVKDASTGVVSWEADEEKATEYLTAADTYTITFDGLDADTYYITETTVPAGYNPLTGDVKVVIAENGTITMTANGQSATAEGTTISIENKSGNELPSTGGMGTTLFYVVGGMMMAAAVVLLVAKKKVSAK